MRRFPGDNQADQVNTKPNVQKPSDESAHKRRRYPSDVERSFMASTQRKNVRGANKRYSHEHSDTRRATPNGCRPKKTPPASSESCARSNPHISRRCLGPHRTAETDSGA